MHAPLLTRQPLRWHALCLCCLVSNACAESQRAQGLARQRPYDWPCIGAGSPSTRAEPARLFRAI